MKITQASVSWAALALLCLSISGELDASDANGNLNYVLDVVFGFLRAEHPIEKFFGKLSVPMTFTEKNIHVQDMVLTNAENLFRVGNASLSIKNGSVVVDVTVQVRDLGMDGDWWTRVLVKFSGTIGFSFDEFTVRAVLAARGLKLILQTFAVTSIGEVKCTKFSGASALSAIVQEVTTHVMNTHSMKEKIASTVEEKAREFFNKIFHNHLWSEYILTTINEHGYANMVNSAYTNVLA